MLHRKMSRSFLCGIIVASTTWCCSLYLYWLLTKSSSQISRNNFSWSPGQDSQQFAVLKHTNPQNGLNQLNGDDDKERRIQEQKDNLYKKYKKEKKFRKISQRLKDELKPIEENGGPGNAVDLFILLLKPNICHNIFNFNSIYL